MTEITCEEVDKSCCRELEQANLGMACGSTCDSGQATAWMTQVDPVPAISKDSDMRKDFIGPFVICHWEAMATIIIFIIILI